MRTITYKASIIVLTYRKFENLKKNIESINLQTYKDYEVILSDDGSPDFNRKDIEQIFKDNKNIKIFKILHSNNNLGTVRNYNRAIRNSEGDIIIPLAQDDVFSSEHALQDIIDVFCDNQVNVCYATRIHSLSGEISPPKNIINLIENGERKKLWLRTVCSNIFIGASLYFRKSYLEELGVFDEKYQLLEDFPIAIKTIERNGHFTILNKPTIIYGVGGVSNGISKKLAFDHILAYEHILAMAPKIVNSYLAYKYLEYKYKVWKANYGNNHLIKYSNILVDILLLTSNIISSLTKINSADIRFFIIWGWEVFVTYLKERL